VNILVAEDNKVTLSLLEKTIKKDGHNVIAADNGQTAWALYKKHNVDIIITDWMLPEISGITLCKKIREEKQQKYTYIIMLTAKNSPSDLVEGFEAGVDDFVAKPFKPDDLIARLQPAMRIVKLEKKVRKNTQRILKKHLELEESYIGTIQILSSLLEMVHPVLGQYMIKVGDLSKKVAEDMGLEKKMVEQIEIAGLFHDIALVGLPQNLIAKNIKDMDETEFAIYSQHVIIASISFNSVRKLSGVGDIILNHHENYDGSGFPKGLKGSEIPIRSMIISAVSDYFRIIDTWPMNTEKIKKMFVENFGADSAQSLKASEPETLIKEAAEKAIDLGANAKYDSTVVEKLKKRIAYEKTAEKHRKWIEIDDLKEGMTLEKSVFLKNGRHLLSKGTILNQAIIKSLKQIKNLKALEGKIYVHFKNIDTCI